MSTTVPDPVYDWDAGLAQGYLGFEVDPTPNDNYTVAGGPTPETDADARKAATDRRDALRTQLSGIELPEVAPSKTSRSSSSSSSGGE
jgi:hypothetical protein